MKWIGPSPKSVKDWVCSGGLHTVKILITVPVLAFLFTLYKYWDETYTQPTNRPAHLTVSSGLEEPGTRDGLTTTKASITIQNTSKQRVKILAGWYQALGWKLQPGSTLQPVHDMTDTKYANDVQRLLGSSFSNAAARHVTVGSQRVVYSDLLNVDWLDPDEKYARSFLVHVLAEAYDVIRLELHIYMINLAKVTDERCAAHQWDGVDGDQRPVRVSAVTLSTVRKPWDPEECVVVYWQHTPSGQILPKTVIQPGAKLFDVQSDAHASELTKQYSLSQTHTVSELSLRR